jgi:hypothetical protein
MMMTRAILTKMTMMRTRKAHLEAVVLARIMKLQGCLVHQQTYLQGSRIRQIDLSLLRLVQGAFHLTSMVG